MQMKKRYVFLDENENVIQTVRAENHDEAVKNANGWMDEDDPRFVTWETDFYSEPTEIQD